jgi:hypothetical protein
LVDEFAFHIRNAHPGDMAAVLATLDAYPGLGTNVEILEQARLLGFTINDRQHLDALITARDLGLVGREQNLLTDDGKALTALETRKPELFCDVVHGLQYVLWDKSHRGANCFSWSYRSLCQLLWHSGTTVMSSRRDMASEIEAQARNAFSKPDISFGPKSIGGALLWLAELEPEVLIEDGTRFMRRTFCAPELFTLGVDFIYRDQGVDYGSNLLLSEEQRDAICQVCLLEPESFDRVLDYAVAQFDYLEEGVGGGWGRYVSLHHMPRLEDFI